MRTLSEPDSAAAAPTSVPAAAFSRRRHIDLQRVASCLCRR